LRFAADNQRDARTAIGDSRCGLMQEPYRRFAAIWAIDRTRRIDSQAFAKRCSDIDISPATLMHDINRIDLRQPTAASVGIGAPGNLCHLRNGFKRKSRIGRAIGQIADSDDYGERFTVHYGVLSHARGAWSALQNARMITSIAATSVLLCLQLERYFGITLGSW